MKCAANIRNFFEKFAVHCKFLVFLSEICSVLQISFCRTDNTFCRTDNTFCRTANTFCRTANTFCRTDNTFCRTDNTFCKTDNLSVICISENLYLFSFIARYIL